MKRLFPWTAIVILVSGCPGLTGQDDPPANAPALAGRWALSGAGGRDAGCLVTDASGDPVSLSGNPEVRRAIDEEVIFFDGSVRTTASGPTTSALAAQPATTIRSSSSSRSRCFRACSVWATKRLELVGVLVNHATIVGTLESRQEAVFANVPPLIQEDGRAQRGGC
ncbi:MAG: hypothetical protein IID43_04700 [Planctomycetes bacterium]|nr:hypothetical protein [Planctomycetota bacterium]